MQSIRQVQRLNEAELLKAVPPSASWHTDYRDTAYIYIGGLPFDLSEGDIITIFSQYGEPVWIKLARDKDSGKSRGFAWLKYEDQRSCDLAVDNLSGAQVMGRMVAVDHARYKKRDDEDETEGYVGQAKEVERVEEDKSQGRRSRRRSRSRSESEAEESVRPLIREEVELSKLMEDHDDDDPMKAYMIEQKKEEVAEALKYAIVKPKSRDDRHRDHKSRHDRSERDSHRHSHRSRRDEPAPQRSRRYSTSPSRSRSPHRERRR